MRWLFTMSWATRVKIILFAFPVLMLLAAALYAVEAGVYVLRSVPVTGTVVQRYEWPGQTIFDRGRTNYEPIFTYAENGETRRASVGNPHTSFDVAVGETASIRAIPGSRGNVRMDTWQGLWFVPAMLGLMGLGSLVIAGLLWRLLKPLFRTRDTT